MYNMMQSMMGLAYGGAGLIFWVTLLLVWAVLILAIVYLWKQINK